MADFAQTELWTRGVGGYHTYRIPALAVTAGGTVLAFCEGRRDSSSDTGQIDLLLRRSPDGGETWGACSVVSSEPGFTTGNPAPVLDTTTGRMWLLLCRNPAEGTEDQIRQGQFDRTVWITHSDDDGVTWARASEITSSVKRHDWTWYATGPCHGIQLRSGRLVIPCDFRRRDQSDGSEFRHSHVILSDDHGETWRIGGIVDKEGTNESVAVELADGDVYLNCRDQSRGGSRIVARSSDGGQTFGIPVADPVLVEPACQGSAVRMGDTDGTVVFANPASTARDHLTIRLSRDGCRTWIASRVIEPGPAAYCDVASVLDWSGNLHALCLYETGGDRPYDRIVLARMSPSWIEAGG